MKWTIAFIGGVVTYLMLSILFSSYDNASLHPPANSTIAYYFLHDESVKNKRFANYEFNYERSLQGSYITKNSNVFREEEKGRKKVRLWLYHGGYSADEPEGWQALRHFYDPKAIDGQHYLSNINSLQEFATWAGSVGGSPNPGIDAVSWALEDRGEITWGNEQLAQLFSWKDGQAYLKDAIETSDLDKKEEYMAAAWRSLGESLHLFMDMACPCHVRNDGHPPYLFQRVEKYVNFWGDPDPYESIAKNWVRNEKFDNNLVDKIKMAKTPREAFDLMATYTNENYFSNQTIYGRTNKYVDILPIVRKNNPYSQPFINTDSPEWEYNESEHIYYRTINGEKIKMCYDGHQGFYGSAVGYPIINVDCVKSQADYLISTAVHAGMYLFSMYLPDIKLKVSTVNTSTVSGTITTNIDALYNGEVYIVKSASPKKIEATGNAIEGDFKIDGKNLKSDTEYKAKIEIGGITIFSDPFTLTKLDPFTFTVNVDNLLGIKGNPFTIVFTGELVSNEKVSIGKIGQDYEPLYKRITINAHVDGGRAAIKNLNLTCTPPSILETDFLPNGLSITASSDPVYVKNKWREYTIDEYELENGLFITDNGVTPIIVVKVSSTFYDNKYNPVTIYFDGQPLNEYPSGYSICINFKSN